jgi:hypothetical protein
VDVSAQARGDGGVGLVDRLRTGHLDLAIAPSGIMRSDVSAELLYQWQLRAALPGHIARPETISPAELSAYEIGAAPLGHRSRQQLQAAFDDDAVTLHVAVESSSPELLRDIALYGSRHAVAIPGDAFGQRDQRFGPLIVTSRGPYGGGYSIYARVADVEQDDSERAQRVRVERERILGVFRRAAP